MLRNVTAVGHTVPISLCHTAWCDWSEALCLLLHYLSESDSNICDWTWVW